jgi:hypothetical protein
LFFFIITLFPLWYWNSQHDWISFRFHLGMRFDGNSGSRPFSLGQLVGYWLISNLYLFPLFGFPLWWVAVRQSGKQVMASLSPQGGQLVSRENYQIVLLLWLSWPIVLLFTLLGGKQQIFPAWPAPGYWGLVILLGAQAVVWQKQRPTWVRRWLWGSGLFLGTLSVITLLHLQLGFLQKPSVYAPFGGIVPIEQDGSIELIDTDQLRQLIAANTKLQVALPEVAFVFTNEYYLGGYFDMALHPLRDIPVTAFSQDPRGFAFWFDQTDWLGQDALLLTLERFAQNATVMTPYRSLFDHLDPLTTLPLRRGGEVVETIYIFRAQNFKQVYRYPYGPQ